MTAAKQPEALRLAQAIESPEATIGDANQSAAELRRLYEENEKLRITLKDLYVAAPTSLECKDFHHSTNERHLYGQECKPIQAYLDALNATAKVLKETK